MSFFTSNFDEIRSGKITDVYFERAKRVLEAKNIRKRARLEVMAKSLPSDWSVFVGLAEILSLLEDLPVNVRSVPEGTLSKPRGGLGSMPGR